MVTGPPDLSPPKEHVLRCSLIGRGNGKRPSTSSQVHCSKRTASKTSWKAWNETKRNVASRRLLPPDVVDVEKYTHRDSPTGLISNLVC